MFRWTNSCYIFAVLKRKTSAESNVYRCFQKVASFTVCFASWRLDSSRTAQSSQPNCMSSNALDVLQFFILRMRYVGKHRKLVILNFIGVEIRRTKNKSINADACHAQHKEANHYFCSIMPTIYLLPPNIIVIKPYTNNWFSLWINRSVNSPIAFALSLRLHNKPLSFLTSYCSVWLYTKSVSRVAPNIQ